MQEGALHCMYCHLALHVLPPRTVLHHYITASLHHYITTSLHHCITTSVSAHWFCRFDCKSLRAITASLHRYITASLHHCITALLHQFITASLHHCSTACIAISYYVYCHLALHVLPSGTTCRIFLWRQRSLAAAAWRFMTPNHHP